MAPLGNKNAVGNTGGRPTKYKPEYCDLAYRNCLVYNSTLEQLARHLGINLDTLHEWKNKYPEFSDAIKRGKDGSDFDVTKSLYGRATGYDHQSVKIFCDPKTGAQEVIEYTEHYPPDVTAQIFWLKNRAGWSDRQILVIEDPDKVLKETLGLDDLEDLPE